MPLGRTFLPTEIQRADLRACRELLRRSDPIAWIATRTVPPRVGAPLAPLAAFRGLVRHVVEAGGGPSTLRDLHQRASRALEGRPDAAPFDRALSAVARGHDLPGVLFDAMVEAASWDLDGRRYATLEALIDHALRDAGSFAVGACLVMGRRRRDLLERACDLAIALSLTRIARDVGSDARAGRVYLPLEWLEEAGADVDRFLSHPTQTPAIRAVTERALSAADRFYLRSDPGIGAMPFDCQPAIRAARYLGASLGRRIESSGFDSVTSAATVPYTTLARTVLRALRPSGAERREGDPHRLDAASFLIEASAR